MELMRRRLFVILRVSAGLALVFCFISLPRLTLWHQNWTEFLHEVHLPQVDFLKNLTVDEHRYLGSFDHLLFLESLINPNGTVVLITRDDDFGREYGRFRAFHMEDSETGDYIRIFMHDEIRALHRLLVEDVQVEDLKFELVRNSSDFSRKWRNSRLVDCLGLNISTVKRVIPESFVNNLVAFRDFVEQYGSSVFLFGGTLLGWYRECSFIRDTTDVDFAMKIDDLSDSLLYGLKQTTLFDLYWILGKKADSLELSVYSNGVKIDLFFLYRGARHDWVGGMIVSRKQKLRWEYPFVDELCTGDLLGMLFNVPCNVEEVLQADYGANWTVPHSTEKFVWYQSHKNVHAAGFWQQSEWKDVYKLFPSHPKSVTAKRFTAKSSDASKSSTDATAAARPR